MTRHIDHAYLEEGLRRPGQPMIFLRSWRPAAPPRAVVVICHGVNAHSGHHAWAAERLLAAGFAVCALDLRGRGRSEGERFFVQDAADYVADLDAAIGAARARDPGAPLFLLGHSAGGVVACSWALDHPGALAGLICESFAYRVFAPRPALAAVKALARLFPRLPALKLKMRDFTRDPVERARLEADPLTKGETQPAATVAALTRANERLEREMASLTAPLLILHGTADRVTDPAGSRLLHAHAGAADKTLSLLDGHVHDLLADLGREEVAAAIVGWIDARR